jgi:predicted glycoside hydrolase/deacetylase ChbG (UPF0249 family)
VLEAHLAGIVTSATAMVLEPAAEEGISEAIGRAPRLALGLHVTLTGGGFPASDPARLPTLLIDGRFARYPADLPREIPAEEVARELDAQIFLFEKMAGAPPTHLDSHHHSALHPSVQPVFAQAALRLEIPARASSAAARKELRAAGVRTPDRFVESFYREGATATNLRSILAGLAHETTELMCHPGHADEELLAGSTYARERERELALLRDPEIPLLLAREKVERVDFRDL